MNGFYLLLENGRNKHKLSFFILNDIKVCRHCKIKYILKISKAKVFLPFILRSYADNHLNSIN